MPTDDCGHVDASRFDEGFKANLEGFFDEYKNILQCFCVHDDAIFHQSSLGR